MNLPVVSVVIPTFNRASTVGRAVRSVLDQTYRQLEVIVVDDGSTDSTNDVLNQFSGKITVIKQPNAGPSAARNTGIHATTGAILAFLDSDDVWLPTKIAQQVRILSLAGEDMPCCICNATILNEFGDTTTSFENASLSGSLETGCLTNPSEILATRFVLFNQVAAVRRQALMDVGGFRENLELLEDYDLAMRLSALGPWGIISAPLVIKHNDTRGIGVTAMNDPKRVYPAAATALRGLLDQPCRWHGRTKQLLETSLRAVEKRVELNRLLYSKSRLLRLIGWIRSKGLRLEEALARKRPAWPRPKVVSMDEAYAAMTPHLGTSRAQA